MYSVLMFADKGYLVDPDTENPVRDEDKDIMNMRSIQLENLRQLCIPEIVLLLYNVLHSAGCFKDAVQLADELASDQYKLYVVYSKDKLSEIVGKISESSLALMNDKAEPMDPWGYEIQS